MNVSAFVRMIEPYPDEERWELLDGEPFLTAPQTERHQRIVTRTLLRLERLADQKGCVALAGLGLLHDHDDDYAPIPDVVVRCGPALSGGYATDPVLVAEVLSPSTMNNDRGRKLDFYRSIPSLRTILIIYQDEVRIESWQRAGEDWRRLVLQRRDDELVLPELDGTLPLEEVYRGVDLA